LNNPVNSDVSNKLLKELIDYCSYFDLPFEHIVETMYALKVIPMIRGICFEFFIYDKLGEILPANDWKIEKPVINAQSAIQDVDILVTHRPTKKRFTIECKLTGKDSFRIKDNQATVKVKCMRSRTVGIEAAKILARRYTVKVDDVMRHRDNYRTVDFDFVITSIGNAFWKTAPDGTYVFRPTSSEIAFLRKFFNDQTLDVNGLKEKTFHYLLIARSSRLNVSPQNNVQCVRRECIKAGTSRTCGFIPNYPIVDLNDNSIWKPIQQATELFQAVVNEQQ
jgi:hypothetical protein